MVMGEPNYRRIFFEKKLDISATTRNWKTVGKLFDTGKYLPR